MKGEAWFLHPGQGAQSSERAQLVRETYEIDEPADDEVLADPLYGCWEGNMGHAVQRKPVDVCKLRCEPRVAVGNAGVVRVRSAGNKITHISRGQNGIIFSAGVVDKFGYPEKIFGYDAPHTMGCLATRIKLKGHHIIPIPANSRHSLAQWAAFSVRYVTAWSNWELAYGVYRLQVSKEEYPSPHVWGWGGGTSLGELDLARRIGCTAAMLSGSGRHLETIAKLGITPIDRRQFGDLTFDEGRFATDADYRRTYNRAEQAFLAEVNKRTDGNGVSIFIDHIGTAVYRATLKALARESVIATAGWKGGMVIGYLRAIECIERHQHVHTHYARYQQGVAAVGYAEANGWMPIVDDRLYNFDQLPELSDKYLAGETGIFPVYSVNPE